MKKAFMIIGAILLVVGIGLLAYVGAVADLDLSNLSSAKYVTSTHPVDGKVRNIEIDVDEADIDFQPSEDGTTSVVIKEQEKVKHSVSEKEGTLRIEEEDHRKWIDHLGFFTNRMTITVYLPAAEYQSLQIKTATGDVACMWGTWICPFRPVISICTRSSAAVPLRQKYRPEKYGLQK